MRSPQICRVSTRRFLSTFVSKYKSKIDDKEIVQYLKRKSFTVRSTAKVFNLKECPECAASRSRNSLPDNQWKLYVQRGSGAFYCHRCGVSGSWFDFKRRIGNPDKATSVSSGGGDAAAATSPRAAAAAAPTTKRPKEPVHPRALAANRELLVEGKFTDVLTYLQEERGLNAEVLRKYGVGAVVERFQDDTARWVEFDCIAFPWLQRIDDAASGSPDASSASGSAATAMATATADKTDDAGWETVRLKVRALQAKGKQRMLPSGGGWGFFGWHLVPKNAVEVVITEGEYDAMAVYQATGVPAISVPNGCRSLPIELLPLLERFERITLWMDDDIAGREGAEQFAEKLGRGRCRIVDPALSGQVCKDANDALRAECDMKLLLSTARVIAHERIVSFADLRADVHRQITCPNQMVGTLFHSMPKLNRVLKGHRRGEMTLVTGPTGAGKTTLMSQLSIDLAQRGVPTLWGSFEIKNDRLASKMLAQLLPPPLKPTDAAAVLSENGNDGELMVEKPPSLKEPEVFAMIADKFETLPIHFMNFFGATDVDEVLDAIEYAAYAHDVQHVVIDNLQFMLGSATGRGFERFDAQERALEKFRGFATSKNVHVSLVVHPRYVHDANSLSRAREKWRAKPYRANNALLLPSPPNPALLCCTLTAKSRTATG